MHLDTGKEIYQQCSINKDKKIFQLRMNTFLVKIWWKYLKKLE